MSDEPETVEVAEPLNDGFDAPMPVTDVQMAFPAQVLHLMPPYEDIPDDFKNGHNEWCRFVTQWFFRGWPTDVVVYQRQDIEGEKAYRHLAAVMRSFEPKHEHKEAVVAWLMSRWYAAIRPAPADADAPSTE